MSSVSEMYDSFQRAAYREGELDRGFVARARRVTVDELSGTVDVSQASAVVAVVAEHLCGNHFQNDFRLGLLPLFSEHISHQGPPPPDEGEPARKYGQSLGRALGRAISHDPSLTNAATRLFRMEDIHSFLVGLRRLLVRIKQTTQQPLRLDLNLLESHCRRRFLDDDIKVLRDWILDLHRP